MGAAVGKWLAVVDLADPSAVGGVDRSGVMEMDLLAVADAGCLTAALCGSSFWA